MKVGLGNFLRVISLKLITSIEPMGSQRAPFQLPRSFHLQGREKARKEKEEEERDSRIHLLQKKEYKK